MAPSTPRCEACTGEILDLPAGCQTDAIRASCLTLMQHLLIGQRVTFLLHEKEGRKRSQCFQERVGAHACPVRPWSWRKDRTTFCSLSSQVALLTEFCWQEAEQDGCPGTTWIRSCKLQSIRVSKAIYVTQHKRQRRLPTSSSAWLHQWRQLVAGDSLKGREKGHTIRNHHPSPFSSHH